MAKQSCCSSLGFAAASDMARTLHRLCAKIGQFNFKAFFTEWRLNSGSTLLGAKLFKLVKRLHRGTRRKPVRVDRVEGFSKNIALRRRGGGRLGRRKQRENGHGPVPGS